MIEILPDHLSKHIEAKCGSLATTPDFFDVIGQVSWYGEEGIKVPKTEAAPAPAKSEPEPEPAPAPEAEPEPAPADAAPEE